MSEDTLATLISCYQVMLPKALKASDKTNINIRQNRYIVLNVSLDEVENYISKCRYENQISILNLLCDINYGLNVYVIFSFTTRAFPYKSLFIFKKMTRRIRSICTILSAFKFYF